MKKIYSLLFLAILCNMAIAQKKNPDVTPKITSPKENSANSRSAITSEAAPMDPADMKAWMNYMTPGPMHQMLAKFNGTWKESVTFWMKPDAPASSSTSTCVNQMIMDNRYQESNHVGDMNGMPFEGRGYLGYDNAKNVFVSTWMDNMGTGIMSMEGKWDEKNKVIHFTGNMVDPMTGKELKVREEFKMIDDNNQLMEMYMTQNGKEFKSLEIKFTR
jgi:hypothetical protein